MEIGVGLPSKLAKHWALVGLNCYLFLSLNFVGVFGLDHPARLSSSSWGQKHDFRASPHDSSRRATRILQQPVRGHSDFRQASPHPQAGPVRNVLPPPDASSDKVDTLDLSKIPSVHVPQLENSIRRFDAYGDYEYIDVQDHPKPIQYHKPLRHRPQGPDPYPHHHNGRPEEPQRRVDYSGQRPHYHRPHYPPPQLYYQTPFRPPAPPRLNFFNPFGEKNDHQPEAASDQGGLFDPLLKLIGLKDDQETIGQIPGGPLGLSSSHLQYHDPLEYDYGDYLEGYQNYVKPQRTKSISERIAKWFGGFKVPSAKPKRTQNFERLENGVQNLDYSQYDVGEDLNLVFHSGLQQNVPQRPGGNPVAGLYDFGDVLQSIRNNETTGEVAKKFLSAAAALSEKSDSNPVFWFWTIPTTVLALGGIVYFVGALSIIGYKYMLQGGNGDMTTLLSLAAVFSIPLILGFVVVGSRSAINGELQVNRFVRGDFQGSMRQDFDGVDFFMDAVFGSAALLGIGWAASIAI